MQKNTVLTLGLLSLATLGLSTADAAVKLVLDNSAPLGMVGETNYDLGNNTIEISLDRPVLCNQAPGYNTGSLTKLRIYDPNEEMKAFAAGEGIYFADNADYMVNNGQLVLETDNPAKALCVSSVAGNLDLIFKSAFEPASQTAAYVKYIGLPSIVSPGQIINYQIEFSNPSSAPIFFDLLEYWEHNSGQHNAYMAAANERFCNDNDPAVMCSVAQYDDSGVMKAIQLDAGGTFLLDVTQTVDVNSATGEELEFMAGVFLTDGENGDFLPRTLAGPHFLSNPLIVNKTVLVENNNAPQLSWEVAPSALTSFNEDDTTEQVFEIRYSDAQTTAANLNVSISYQQNNIVDVVTGPFVADGFDGTMTLDVLPLANAFTNTPEQVTVTVTDGGGLSSTLTFDVEVNPVNDAPTFAMNCNELTINEQDTDLSCTNPLVNRGGNNQIQGVWNGQSIIANFNPGPNEGQQSVLEYEIQVTNNNDGILDESGNGEPVWISPTTGDINIVNVTGQYGTATVQVRVKDDGGNNGANGCGPTPANPEHGCDVSEWETLTIVSSAPIFTLSGIINGLPQGSFVNMNLRDAGNGDAFVENENKTNVSGDDPLAFSFDYEAADQFNYKVVVDGQSNGLNCDIESASGTEPNPDTTVGTVNGANVTDLVVTCSAN
ncbi:MAG: cadherin-like domain-containing protein [Proteobacteria bacterium]|nr:cadherin-like domain-containing protein [Pseudomonadota bacterium]